MPAPILATSASETDNLSHAAAAHRRGRSQLEGVVRARRRAALGMVGPVCPTARPARIALTSGGSARRAIAMATE